MSPIENMWAILKLRIAEKRSKNIELKNCITKTWQEFTPEECLKYALSAPEKMYIMSQRKGHHRGY